MQPDVFSSNFQVDPTAANVAQTMQSKDMAATLKLAVTRAAQNAPQDRTRS